MCEEQYHQRATHSFLLCHSIIHSYVPSFSVSMHSPPPVSYFLSGTYTLYLYTIAVPIHHSCTYTLYIYAIAVPIHHSCTYTP